MRCHTLVKGVLSAEAGLLLIPVTEIKASSHWHLELRPHGLNPHVSCPKQASHLKARLFQSRGRGAWVVSGLTAS